MIRCTLYCLIASSYAFHFPTLLTRSNTILHSVKKDSFNSYSIPMGYLKTLPSTLPCDDSNKGTIILHGSNAVEHVINLLDESPRYACNRRVLVVCGWNPARIDPLMWELEPREYFIHVETISGTSSSDDVGTLVNAILTNAIDMVIAMGSSTVIDVAKTAVTIVRGQTRQTRNDHILWMNSFGKVFNEDEIQVAVDIPLIVVPITPCTAAHFNSIACIHSLVHTPTMPILQKIAFKDYVDTVVPDMCVLQANLLYNLPMALLHDKLVCLFAAALDLVLLSSEFTANIIGWTCLKQITPILLKSIQSIESRYHEKKANISSFQELTTNDMDPKYYSQYSRRYSHGLDERDVEQVTLVTAQLALATNRSSVSSLSFLADVYTINIKQTIQHSYASAQIFLLYIQALDLYMNVDDADMNRAEIRVKINAVNELLTYISNDTRSMLNLSEQINSSYVYLDFVQDNSTRFNRYMPPLQLSIADAEEIALRLNQICGEAASKVLGSDGIHWVFEHIQSVPPPIEDPCFDVEIFTSEEFECTESIRGLESDVQVEQMDAGSVDSIDRLQMRMKELRG